MMVDTTAADSSDNAGADYWRNYTGVNKIPVISRERKEIYCASERVTRHNWMYRL